MKRNRGWIYGPSKMAIVLAIELKSGGIDEDVKNRRNNFR